MKKSFLIGWITCVILFGVSQLTFAAEDEPSLDLAEGAKSAILIEQDTGKILFEKNAHEQFPPASMAKIMTLLLAMEAIEKGELTLDETVRVSERASSMGGSQVFLETGEEISIEDLIKSIAIASGNDASVALAERIAGSEEAFVQKMNDKVKELGLENTVFQNSSGLPAPNLYSSAYDLAMMAKELLKYEKITDYTSIYEDYLRKGQKNEFWLVNTNKLVRFYDGVDGLKTGFTREAKYCLTATAKRGDMRVIAVVMGVDSAKERNGFISQMLDYAFNHYETKKVYEKNEVVSELNLLKAHKEKVPVVTPKAIHLLHRKGEEPENIQSKIFLDDHLALPLKEGDVVGQLVVKDGEDIITESPLIVMEDVEKANYFTLFKRTLRSLAKNIQIPKMAEE